MKKIQEHLFTFLADFDGGTYVSQAIATNRKAGKKAWGEKFSQEILGLTSNGQKNFLERVESEEEAPIEGLSGVWCFCPTEKKKVVIVHFVETVNGKKL